MNGRWARTAAARTGGEAPSDWGCGRQSGKPAGGKVMPSFLGIKVAPAFTDIVRDGDAEDFLSHSSAETSAVTYFSPHLHGCHLAIPHESAWLAGRLAQSCGALTPSPAERNRVLRGTGCPLCAPCWTGPETCGHSLLVRSTALQVSIITSISEMSKLRLRGVAFVPAFCPRPCS